MKPASGNFQQAWQKLVTDGEMLGQQPTQEFTPLGIRTDVQETAPLYHGTKADLKAGDLIQPGQPSNYGSRQIAHFVYATANKAGAALAAELALGEGQARLYLVEATGKLEDDPNVTDKKFPGNPSRSYRTRAPLRVIAEDHDWQPLPPDALAKIRQQLQAAAQQGIEAIND